VSALLRSDLNVLIRIFRETGAFLVGVPPSEAAEYQPPRFRASDLGRFKQIQDDTERIGHIDAKQHSYVSSLWNKAAST
jgi:hypothetical protein